mmetsp:Transcript_9573/g.28195  ORF Transcript_9573/g.28195 Transcript_9573/m.28195 type:complete len:343 (+) Transcript_9573:144-1172(+)
MGGGGLIILANATRRGTKASSSRRYRCSSTYRRCRRCRHRSLCISMRLCRIRCPPRGSRPCPRSGRSGTPRVGSRRRLLERCLNPLQRRLRLVQRRIGLCTRRPGLRPRNLDFRQRRLGSRLFLLVCIRLLLRLVPILPLGLVRSELLLAAVRLVGEVLVAPVRRLLLLRLAARGLKVGLGVVRVLLLLVGGALHVEELPAAVLVEALDPRVVDVLHDCVPVEVCRALVKLDVARVEPRLERVEVLDVDRVDVERLLGEVLEDEHEVEVLEPVHDPLEVRDLDVGERHHEPRRLRQLDERVDGGHDEGGGLVVRRHAVEAELAVRDVELEVLGLVLNLLREV